MNGKTIIVLAALLVLITSIGVISAHQYSTYENQNTEFKEHYREMIDLHQKYFSNEIGFEEFWERMNSDTYYEEDMPCHRGFGMMGMMW